MVALVHVVGTIKGYSPPTLEIGGQVVNFVRKRLGKVIPSPAILEQIGIRFRTCAPRTADLAGPAGCRGTRSQKPTGG